MKSPRIDVEQIKREYSVAKFAGRLVALRAQRQGAFPWSGPCPIHSPDSQARDSTSFACDDVAWVCVNCGGGDIIALVAQLNSLDAKADFRQVVDIITGGVLPPQLSPAEAAASAAERAAEQLASETERNEWRDKERGRAYDLYYKYAMPIARPEAQPARDYLTIARGVALPPRLHLRFDPAARYYMPDKPRPRLIHTGPALLAQIQRRDPNGEAKFAGVHITWFDLARPKGKPLIVDPKSGEPQLPKKMRGSKKGGHIDLTGCADPRVLVLGEGIEKVLAIETAMRARGRDLERTAFWSAGDWGNLAGKHAANVPHPTLKTPTGRAKGVPGPDPDWTSPAIQVPASVERLVLLGDSTSDPFMTQCVMARAGLRYARPGLEIVCAWSPAGKDFDDLLREAM